MPRVTAENLKAAIGAHVDPKATMMTDEFSAYRLVGHEDAPEARYQRHSVMPRRSAPTRIRPSRTSRPT